MMAFPVPDSGGSLLDAIMVGATYGGLAALPALAIMCFLSRQSRTGAALLAASGASLLLTLPFQFLAQRPRPDAALALIPVPNFPSFPSGHAALAFSAAAVIGFRLRRVSVWMLALAAAGLIAASRVYLGVHYDTDVLAGAALGFGVGAGTYGLAFEGAGRQRGLRWLVWPQAGIVFVISLMAYLDLVPKGFLIWAYADKTLHFILFGLTAFFLELWMPTRRLHIRNLGIPAGPLVLMGVVLTDEILQLASPARSADICDLAADALGIAIFGWLAALWRKKHMQPS